MGYATSLMRVGSVSARTISIMIQHQTQPLEELGRLGLQRRGALKGLLIIRHSDIWLRQQPRPGGRYALPPGKPNRCDGPSGALQAKL
jgi:hypothetical protein